MSAHANVCLSFTAKDSRSKYDVDLAAFVYDSQGMMIGWAFDRVCFGNAIRHSGDGGDGSKQGFDEVVFVDFNQMPPNAQFIFCAVALEDPKSTLADFSELNLKVPELNFQYDFLRCGQPMARVFLPFALQRNGTTAQFLPSTPHLMSPDVGLDHVWPLTEAALQSLLPGAVWQHRMQQLVVDPKKVRPGQTVMVHHSQPSSHPDQPDHHSENPDQADNTFYFGLGWDSKCDLDAHVYELDQYGKTLDHVYFGQKTSDDGGIIHSGDNLTGEGKGDDEVVKIDTTRIASHVHAIVFVVEIYNDDKTFKKVKGEFVRVFKKFGKKEALLAKYKLDSDKSFDKANAGIFCILRRVAKSWRFEAISAPLSKPVNKEDLARAIALTH